VRISVSGRSAYDLYLTRALKHAELVRCEGLDASYERFVADKLDALSGLRPRLAMDVQKLPGAKILEGRFTAIQQAVATPKGRPAGAQYLREFVAEVKASGFVADLIERNGARGLSVAP
jgi:polar amino acid transport system substrate-binding protein